MMFGKSPDGGVWFDAKRIANPWLRGEHCKFSTVAFNVCRTNQEESILKRFRNGKKI